MSDQGEGADQWRPATNRSDNGRTTPIPKTDDSPGFPSVDDDVKAPQLPAWALEDDDTGEFPPLSDDKVDPPSGPPMRDPFEPLDRSNGAAAAKSDAEPAVDRPSSQDTSPGVAAELGTASADPEPGGPSSFDRAPGASSFGEAAFDPPSVYEAEPKEPFTAPPRVPVPPPKAQSVPPKAPTAPPGEPVSEEQAAENEFFAPDDQAWDRRVAPVGPPPQPGKPSSGNLRMPDWMREEEGAGSQPGDPPHDGFEEKRSRLPLLAGVGLLLVGLMVAGGVFFLKGGDASGTKAKSKERVDASKPARVSKNHGPPDGDKAQDRPLPQFKGQHTKAAGRVVDQRAGLSYAKLAKPWQPAVRKSPMVELGFSQSQFLVTEKAGATPQWWGRLMSAELSGSAKGTYQGPGTERKTTMEVAEQYEARLYGFRHKKRLVASQPLEAAGHKGWLVAYQVTFHRPKVRATGDLVAVAVVDTGKKSPGVLVMTMPSTVKKRWSDVNYVVRGIKVA